MAKLVPPHGGKGLTECLLQGAELESEKKKAPGLKKIDLAPREKDNVLMMGIGAFSPLTGFMTKADWNGVCEKMLLSEGGEVPDHFGRDEVPAILREYYASLTEKVEVKMHKFAG